MSDDRETIITTNAAQTKAIAARLVRKIAHVKSHHARVFALSGDLGAGKTTFVQGFARALGVKTPVTSPTFVLMKIYALEEKKHLKHLVHIDAYRIEDPQELMHLGFDDLLRDKDAVILIEWAERMKKILPRGAVWLKFEHGKNISERIIQIKNSHGLS